MGGCIGKSSKPSVDSGSNKNNNDRPVDQARPAPVPERLKVERSANVNKEGTSKDDSTEDSLADKTFTFKELADATNNFNSGCLLGEGGFGKVYKGHLEKINQVVAVKKLDLEGIQGTKEFLVEILALSLANHSNLVKLLGYCAEGDQRLLVYEYMPLGSLDKHLFDLTPDIRPLDWNSRIQIAAGTANGLVYLHETMEPPIIYRDLKTSNILLDEDYHPKLSDFGMAKLGPIDDNTHVSTRVMGTYGYCAPDYLMTGQLNFKSDVYGFGVVFLELLTGRKAIDEEKDRDEQNLVMWAKPLIKDRRNYSRMVDPLLEGRYPVKELYQCLAIAAMCVNEKAKMRPDISEVATSLSSLAKQKYMPVQGPKR